MPFDYDAVIVGSGPNGFSAGITLAQSGLSVLIIEGEDTIGGGVRSAELTQPGIIHDSCSAIFPLTLTSPYLKQLPLEQFGLEWVFSPAEAAHPLDDGSAVTVTRSLDETADRLGRDGDAYRTLMQSIIDDWGAITDDLLGPLPLPPKHPLAFVGFSLLAARPATNLARSYFKEEATRALFAGMAAHSILPLEQLGSGAFGIVLSALAHTTGWPLVKGGSQNLTTSLAEYFKSLGGAITTGNWIQRMEDLPPSRIILLDVTPRQFARIAGEQLSKRYIRQLSRFRYGPGVYKVDYALEAPIPWAAEECLLAATVHLGGTMQEIADSERDAWRGQHSDNPYVLLAQQSLFDPSRAPDGRHTAWAYCHVPNGSTRDMTAIIDDQIERFAPGFKDTVLARNTRTAVQMEEYNPNYVGGDIVGGSQDLRQVYTRPLPRIDPYRTPLKNVYLCSSSTPPGGGVHGMCGYHAAQSALRRL